MRTTPEKYRRRPGSKCMVPVSAGRKACKTRAFWSCFVFIGVIRKGISPDPVSNITDGKLELKARARVPGA